MLSEDQIRAEIVRLVRPCPGEEEKFTALSREPGPISGLALALTGQLTPADFKFNKRDDLQKFLADVCKIPCTIKHERAGKRLVFDADWLQKHGLPPDVAPR
jgi:hypothetical protein